MNDSGMYKLVERSPPQALLRQYMHESVILTCVYQCLDSKKSYFTQTIDKAQPHTDF